MKGECDGTSHLPARELLRGPLDGLLKQVYLRDCG